MLGTEGVVVGAFSRQAVSPYQPELVCELGVVGADDAPFDGGHVMAEVKRKRAAEPDASGSLVLKADAV